jgi:hypothetical protein
MDLNVNVIVSLDKALLKMLSNIVTAIRPGAVSTQSAAPAPEHAAAPAEAIQAAAPEHAAAPAQAESKEITDLDLRAAVGPKTKEVGKDKIFALLAEFGVNRVPDLSQEQRADFITKVKAL